eukprot:6492089-Amphidinium_carterae.2
MNNNNNDMVAKLVVTLPQKGVQQSTTTTVVAWLVACPDGTQCIRADGVRLSCSLSLAEEECLPEGQQLRIRQTELTKIPKGLCCIMGIVELQFQSIHRHSVDLVAVSDEVRTLQHFYHDPEDAMLWKVTRVAKLNEPQLVWKVHVDEHFVNERISMLVVDGGRTVANTAADCRVTPSPQQTSNFPRGVSVQGTPKLLTIQLPSTLAELVSQHLWSDVLTLGRWGAWRAKVPAEAQMQLAKCLGKHSSHESVSVTSKALLEVAKKLRQWAPQILCAELEHTEVRDQVCN